VGIWWTMSTSPGGTWWTTQLVEQPRPDSVVVVRGGRRRPAAEAITSSTLHPVRLRSPQGPADARPAITSRVRALSGFLGRFVHHRRVAREGRSAMGARKDATGIPVSVLLPGVEV
jgi:hypothetical protein